MSSWIDAQEAQQLAETVQESIQALWRYIRDHSQYDSMSIRCIMPEDDVVADVVIWDPASPPNAPGSLTQVALN